MATITVRKISNTLESLSVKVRLHHGYLTVDEILSLSHSVAPSHLRECLLCYLSVSFMSCAVRNGGILLEAFLVMCAGYSDRREWTSINTSLAQEGDVDMQPRMDALIKSVQTDFYFYVLSSIAARGTAANRQLFFLSLVMQHKGLSRSGLEVLSKMNMGLAPRSFDPELLAHQERQKHKNRCDTVAR